MVDNRKLSISEILKTSCLPERKNQAITIDVLTANERGFVSSK
jgi:hypothetical protein